MTPEEELRFLILGAQREGNRILASLLAPLDITPSQSEVLRILAEAGALSLNALGRRLVCETGSPSRLVSTLVGRGWVQRREDERDRRQVTLALTPQGADMEKAVRAVEEQLHQWIASHLSAAEVSQTSRVLAKMLEETAAGRAIEERIRPAGSNVI
jgi:DNA-binding MarR family transcriptional regulator